MGILKSLLDFIVFAVWMQFDAAWREIERAFPSTFGRVVAVVKVHRFWAPGANPGLRCEIEFRPLVPLLHHIPFFFGERKLDAPDRLAVNIATEELLAYPSYANNDRGKGGCMDSANWFGIPTGLVFSALLWPVRTYYGLVEEYTHLDRNARALLRKLKGKIPPEAHQALERSFINRRSRELGRG